MTDQQGALRAHEHRWAVVLAGGQGRRLRELTTTTDGVAIPKQYCSLWGGPSLLHETLERARRVVARERVCTIVAAAHRRWWEVPLWQLPARNVIVQPDDRGTAIGLLLSLLHILRRDPDAHVLLLPSDHHARDEEVLSQALREALAWTHGHREEILLLGFVPDHSNSQMGYIVPGAELECGCQAVATFVEKPTPSCAQELISRGALWNGFLIAASARALLKLYELRHAEVVERLRTAVERQMQWPGEGSAVAGTYAKLPSVDFSRDVLAGLEERLRVRRVDDCGWSDLGCPQAIARVLERAPRRQRFSAGPWTLDAHCLSTQLRRNHETSAISRL